MKIENPCYNASLEVGVEETEWYGERLPFKPSVKQLLSYCLSQHQVPYKNYKTKRATFDDEALEKLRGKYPEDGLYQKVQIYREIDRAKGTYVDGKGFAVGKDGRVHPTFLHSPSTLRFAAANPPIQQIPRSDDDESPLYKKIRELFIAPSGKVLLARDYCVDPKSKILKTDLTWANAEDIQIGDELIGFDEKVGVGHHHYFKPTRVLRTARIFRPKVKVTTTQGVTIVAANHPFVARKNKGKRKWVEAKDLIPGWHVGFLAKPWEQDQTRDGGYLAGFLDGEGWVHRTSTGFGQNPGITLDYVRDLLKAKGIVTRTNTNKNRFVQFEMLSGLGSQLELLGKFRPVRLLAKARALWEGRRTWGKCSIVAEVISVEPLEDGDVIAIETDAQTYISDGYFSHNSGIEARLVAYLAGDKDLLRLTGIGNGPHSFVVSQLLKKPIDLSWDDEKVGFHAAEIKKNHKVLYDSCKTALYTSLYLGGPGELVRSYPKLFKTIEDAKGIQDVIWRTFPSIPKWQENTWKEAHKLGFLQCPDGFRHYYWAAGKSSFSKKSNSWETSIGPEGKSAISMRPQHLGALYMSLALSGAWNSPLRESMRLTIHDELMLEISLQKVQESSIMLKEIMERPNKFLPLPKDWGLGDHLVIYTEAKAGPSWASMKKLKD